VKPSFYLVRAEHSKVTLEKYTVGNYLYRVVDNVLGSELIPVFLRMKIMRGLGFNIAKDACIWPRCSLRSRKIKIGSMVFINIGFFFDGATSLTIERDVRIGQFVRIITATHEIGPPWQRCTIEAITKPVRIEEGCWIGSGVTILPGVTVRQGCVVGAHSLVTKSTEPNGLYVGNPAKRIRDLPAGSKDEIILAIEDTVVV
jgi:maltose O-acetyltransferase